MCGIVGYVGARQATPVLVNALKKLEYRGYDSAGIAVLQDEDIVVRKAKGALKFLERKIAAETIRGSIGIGHTRWATHGEPSDINSHPHTDVSGRIAIVHNGIIENYARLKEWLQSRGVVFRSQTDTEVIAHLINYYYEGDIFSAVLQALQRLEGSYALGVLCRDFPDRIIAVRKDSPLVVGLGQGENLLASDVPALLEYTREVYFLEDRELAVLYTDHVDLFTAQGEKIIRAPYHVDWDLDSAEKGGFEHFMLKEIHEQPKALRDTLTPRITKEADGTRSIRFDEVAIDGAAWKNAKRIVITACGTAYHAGVVGKYAFEHFVRIPVEVDIASEYRYRDPVFDPSDVFIVISQSGETADTLAAVRLARSAGAKILAVTNAVGSTLSREADLVLYTWAGPEIAVASTKAFTTQLTCLYLLALKMAEVRGSLSHEQLQPLTAELEALPAKAERILANKEIIQKFAARQFNKNKVFFMGRLFDYAISLESALKLKEISYTHSEAFAAGELKHGPIALVDESTLIVATATQRALFDKIASNIIEVASRGASSLVITQDQNGYFADCADETFVIPDVSDVFSPIISIIPAQLFAYYCAVQRGNDPDKPRNLAKSVTVE
ncbi:glutamine--fructose-6-phosphate transaminase (isomerizing) [Treponema brennaborense]|uniref:Glutamine--fructose-6-phosphate aminotransferase [isomerizing] n=1 Tax=Treponema brennaborense (strain DSM 12168 / CIP 105900 / DD5/3) TaxID=906968 RepID=F4LQA0_TREBD|nr:glutamine--fructose-6-phosphate transaminase (isomerizing) [Treponema brennaborense]AEE16121.1 Glucosamine--fructose-6-phosphate aminotransferase (isomerizing) [Treponema brennaborense DSM 12168]